MTAQLDAVALNWLSAELLATLNQARQALDHPGAGLAAGRPLLQQALGALRMLELPGAVAVAEEADHLAQALEQHQPTTAQAATVLRQALEHLPRYLERVQRTGQHAPQVLHPLLNTLRAARLAPALDEPSADAPPPLPDWPSQQPYLDNTDRDALRSVVTALCDDLVRHQEQLEQFTRSDRQHPDALSSLLPPLRQVADTLAVLGFEQPRRVIADQLAAVQGLAQGQAAPTDAALMDVAGALLYVEHSLAAMAGPDHGNDLHTLPPTDIGRLCQVVWREVLVGLAQARAAIEHVALDGWQTAHNALLAELFRPLRGALLLAEQAQAGHLLGKVGQWLLSEAPGQAPALEHLADAICAVEYHLQRALVAPDQGAGDSLALARNALSQLALAGHDSPLPAPPPNEDPDAPLAVIFQHEAEGHISQLQAFVDDLNRHGPSVPSDALHRALHTLKGSAYMAGAEPVAQLAAALDLLCREYKAHQLAAEPADQQLLTAAVPMLHAMLAALPGGEVSGRLELADALRERCAQRLDQAAHSADAGVAAAALIRQVLHEGMDTLLDADTLLNTWRQHPQERAELDALLDGLTRLAHAAHSADLLQVDALCEALLDVYGAVEDGSLGVVPVFFDEAHHAHEALIDMLDQLAAGQTVMPAPERVAALNSLLEQALAPQAMGLLDSASGQMRELPSAPEASDAADTPADPEWLQVFLDEGFDIVESAGAALLRWEAEPGNTLEVENLLRDLHTLKGGARMVEIAPIGDLAHELETVYERVSSGLLLASPELFKLLQKGHDRLGQMLDATRSGQPVQANEALVAKLQSLAFAPVLRQHPSPPPAPLPEPAAPLVERGSVDMVKVTAQVLEDLGNLAGEAAIARGRVEQQVNDTRSTLHEVDMTLQRMRDQLLRLDSETQAGQREQAFDQAAYDDFDPLEMDRHSQLAQLTRALFESVSDLLDLKDTLDDRVHEAQALLAHQARVSSQLQEGLMRTRMVPFERVVPRLQRIVRQVAEELGKQVIFETGHADAEIDRTVLERMIAPLEHMLRNAVDHGLESSEQRRAAGKPEAGLIALEVTHEGAEVVIELADDGAGVPLDAVRSKAVKRGLLAADSDMNDHDVMQFILQPGFSTAQKITQISGRGLGMDVVHEEVKQLGGSMTIDSRRGIGARFQIRLPLEVSVNRALLVQCADDLYAVPLNSIEGIVRVQPGELDQHYQHTPPRYRYGGITHELRYLGELLHTGQRPALLGEEHALPVLLVRSHDHQVAVQVDAISGSREIVVKGLGPQFSAVPGLNGATILGDGRVVLILDLLGQIRAQHLRQAMAGTPNTRPGPQAQRPRLVLVVDDSVTVRKVTSRLLERHGMRVLTARDGVEAMAILQEQRPDVMLLDIEMPRMDGFEVASKVRADARLKSLPIIMITSRTGEKHRERAMAIGVNEYLGKPYQESQLLACIGKWSRRHA